MILASLLTVVLEYPGSVLHQAIASRLLRNALLGVGLGGYIALLAYSPWAKRSGAHINPAVTWAFFRVGKIQVWDAVLYTLAQFVGAIFAVKLMNQVLGEYYAHPSVYFVVTQPGPRGLGAALVAEFVISFVLMLVMLMSVNARTLERLTGAFTGILIALYLAVESPLSGMSLNPARSFGSALAAHHWSALWIYFIAPPLGMLVAAELYLRVRNNRGRLTGPSYPIGRSLTRERSS